jgi:hypothetical protein
MRFRQMVACWLRGEHMPTGNWTMVYIWKPEGVVMPRIIREDADPDAPWHCHWCGKLVPPAGETPERVTPPLPGSN